MDKITQIRIRKRSGCQCNVWRDRYERRPLVKVELEEGNSETWGHISTFKMYREGAQSPEGSSKDCMDSDGTVVEVYFEEGHCETFEYEAGWPHLKEFFNTWSTNGNVIPGHEQTVTFEDSEDFIV